MTAAPITAATVPTADRAAPVIAESEILIAADADTVWSVLTGFGDWPSWNPDVRSVTFDGECREGAVLTWKAGPGSITSILRRVDPPRSIAWTGTTLGLRAVHVHRLEPRDGGTAVWTEESWDGALDAGLTHLRAEAERRAAA